MPGSLLESSRTNGKGTNTPPQLLEHCFYFKKFNCKKQTGPVNGPLAFGNSRTEPWPDPFHHCGALLTAEVFLQAKLLPLVKLQFSETVFKGPERQKGQQAVKWGTEPNLSAFKACTSSSSQRKLNISRKLYNVGRCR